MKIKLNMEFFFLIPAHSWDVIAEATEQPPLFLTAPIGLDSHREPTPSYAQMPHSTMTAPPRPLHLLRALGLLFAECIWRTKMHASGTDAGSEKTPSTLWEQQEVSGWIPYLCVCLFHIWNPGILNFGIKDNFYKTCWCRKNNQLLGKERWIWFRMNQINYVA